MRLSLTAICVLTLIGFHAPLAWAQSSQPGKPKGGLESTTVADKELDEQLFLLYLLEHCYRDTFTVSGEPRLGDRDTLAITLRQGNPVKIFLQERRVQLERVIARFNSKTISIDADLQTCFDDYRKLLSAVEVLDSALDKRYEEFLRPIRELYAEVDREAARKFAAALVDATDAGLGAAANAPDDDSAVGRGLAAFLFVGAIRGEKVRQEKQTAYRRAMVKETEYREKETPRLINDIQAKLREFAKVNGQQRQVTYRRAKAAAVRLAAESVDKVEKTRKALVPGLNAVEEARLKEVLRRAEATRWDTSEATFDPDRDPARVEPGTRPRDPFRSLWLTQQAVKRDKLTVAEVVPLAQDCLTARALVPSAQNYLFLKQRLAFEAGMLANRAAAAEAGPDGFRAPNKNQNSAAGVAYRAWEAFQVSERLDKVRVFNGATVAHQQAIAYAQAGHRGPAYRAIQAYLNEVRTGKRTPPTRAEVWYDFARVCALRLDERLSQPSPDVPLTIFCLKMAKFLGSNNVDKALDGAEFEYVRKTYGREKLKADLDIRRLADD